jgi:hypothetical protein
MFYPPRSYPQSTPLSQHSLFVCFFFFTYALLTGLRFTCRGLIFWHPSFVICLSKHLHHQSTFISLTQIISLYHFLCPLLMPYWTSLCVLCRTCRQSSLYETLFHCDILSKHHQPLLFPIIIFILYTNLYTMIHYTSRRPMRSVSKKGWGC